MSFRGAKSAVAVALKASRNLPLYSGVHEAELLCGQVREDATWLPDFRGSWALDLLYLNLGTKNLVQTDLQKLSQKQMDFVGETFFEV